jgi:hypothetical protein
MKHISILLDVPLYPSVGDRVCHSRTSCYSFHRGRLSKLRFYAPSNVEEEIRNGVLSFLASLSVYVLVTMFVSFSSLSSLSYIYHLNTLLSGGSSDYLLVICSLYTTILSSY